MPFMKKTRISQSLVLPASLLLISFIVYLVTLAPGITWAHEGADGGDLITAAYTLGIPHPPGYPFYVLLGRLFSLVPLRNVAYRLNLMSATCAALAVVVFHLWARATLQRASAGTATRWVTGTAASASLLLAFSRLFWSQALIAEVYALNALMVALILYLLWRWDGMSASQRAVIPNEVKNLAHWKGDSSSQKTLLRTTGGGAAVLALLAFVYGLSLGNHLTMLLLLPLLLYYLSSSPHFRQTGWRGILLAGICFLAGLAVYLYLPLRAAARPFLNWGDPLTFDRFCWMVSGALYRHYVFALPPGYLPMRLAKWAGDFVWQFGPWGVALGLMGAWTLAGEARRQFICTASILTLYSAYAIGYNTADSYVYLIPAYLIWAFWISRGMFYLLDSLGVLQEPRSRRAMPIVGLMFLLPLISLVWNFAALDLSRDHEASDYAEAVLGSLPAHALVISAADEHTFTLWYAQQVEKKRPDLLILDRDLLPYDWYRRNVLPRYPGVIVPVDGADAYEWLTCFLDENIARWPILLTDADERLMARYHAEQRGPVYQLTGR